MSRYESKPNWLKSLWTLDEIFERCDELDRTEERSSPFGSFEDQWSMPERENSYRWVWAESSPSTIGPKRK